MKWLEESNRLKHLFYTIPCALLFTILFGIGLNIGMEFKDQQYGGKFDWLDIAAGTIGAFIGQAIQLLIIFLCL